MMQQLTAWNDVTAAVWKLCRQNRKFDFNDRCLFTQRTFLQNFSL